MIRSRGNGRRPACHSIGDGYVQGRTSGKNYDEQSLTSQVDFGWAVWKTQKTATFSQKAENYLLDVCCCRKGYSCYSAKKKQKRQLHLTFLSYLLFLLTKTTGYILGFHQGKFAGSLLVKLLLAHSYLKILQVTQLNAGNTRSREM